MATTYEKIASVTVGSGGAADIEFTSIPGTFDDLVIKISARSTKGTTTFDGILATFNGSTANFSYRNLAGDGGVTGAYSLSASNNNVGFLTPDTYTANSFNNYECYIPNYAGSTNKSLSIDAVTETNATESYMAIQASLWTNTAAITTIKLAPSSATNFKQYSTATLYGIKKS